MEKITIIVPVYNVEKYLREAIESAINQTYKNLEIIIVDDGSKDNSGSICDEYKNKDERIIVVHQENKGLSGARNTGLDLATGKYIMFLDSDDTFQLDACEKLYNYIEKTNADYVVGNYINTDEDGTLWDNPVFDKNKYVEFKLSIEDYTHSFYTMNSGVWNKIFRKSFLDELQIKFVERVPAEDAIFTTYCFIKSKNVYYMPEIVYNYRLRYSDSISTSCSKSYFMGINKAYRIIYNNFRENNRLDFYRYFYAKSMNYILYKFIDSDKLTREERIDVLDTMKWFYVLSNELKIPTILKSVQYIIESITEKDYEQALKYCEILNQVRKMLPKEIKEKMSKPSANTYKQIKENSVDVEIIEKKEKLLKEMSESKIEILSTEDSLNKLLEGKSIANFSDIELDFIIGNDVKFQAHNEELAKKLKEVLRSTQDFCLIGIPDEINKFENLTEESEKFWINNMYENRSVWLEHIHEDMQYCTSNISRIYVRRKDRSNCGKYFSMLKNVWVDKNIIICEEEQGKIGIANDLLDNAKSVKRVLCSSEEAFNKYDELLSTIKNQSKDNIILIDLGPIGTILAYDLAKEGYQALDLKHFDTEYSLYKKNYGKQNSDFNEIDDEDIKNYKSQIISEIK